MLAEPTRLSVFCGFLGSGKTTFLRHQLRTGALGKVALIINEAAAVPVDPELMPFIDLAVLADGCACCTARTRLIDLLCRMMLSDPPARIVLETSGLADPAPIIAAVNTSAALAGRLMVSEVVTLVDAVYGAATLREEALARAQVTGADALILTKLDQSDPAHVAALAAGLHLMNPRAALFGAIKGQDLTLPSYEDVMPLDLTGGAPSHPLTALTLPLAPGTDWPVLSLWVAALLQARGDQVLRMKAVIGSPAGRLLLQTVRQTIQTPEILPDRSSVSGDGQLAILGRDLSADALAQSLAVFLRAANTLGSHQKT